MFALILSLLSLSNLSHSAHPLLQISEIIESNIEIYAQDGQLMVLSPKNPSVFFPFRDPAQQLAPRPQNLVPWVHLPTECEDNSTRILSNHSYIGETYQVEAVQQPDGLHVYWKQNDTLLAEQLIMQQANPCAIHVLDADAATGLEIIVAWQFSPEIKGFTIYKVPDTALIKNEPVKD